jgi:hypothetical protein
MIDEALRIVDEAEDRNITLRVMGAVAFRIHCPKFSYLLDNMNRQLSDIDYAGYSKQKMDTIKMFTQLGYALDSAVLLLGRRLRFYGNSRPVVDVFLDELAMCHTIDFRSRLDRDKPTIPLADLLLEKMQIVRLTEKDMKDAIVLLREHAVGSGEQEMINAAYIAKILANDWGFYYTVTTNLRKVLEAVPSQASLSEADVKDVSSKVDAFLEAIESAGKTLKWKMRARVGPKQKWYTDVDESPH